MLASTAGGNAARIQARSDPGEEGPCAITTEENVDVNDVQTDFYYPSSSQCTGGPAAPYPAIVFAHGFSMFELTNGADDNADNGEHLAGWGYVVAIPVLPDEDPDERVTILQALLSYLTTQTATPGPFLYQKVDAGRLAAAGHSYGGATVLALAARDRGHSMGLSPPAPSNLPLTPPSMPTL